MILMGTDPTQHLTVDSKKQLVYPDQLLMSVVIRISELRAIGPVNLVTLAIIAQGLAIDLENLTVGVNPAAVNLYRLTIDMGIGKKAIWDFADVKPGTESFTVVLSGTWKAEESAGATKIRQELLLLRERYDITSFTWGSGPAAVVLPA